MELSSLYTATAFILPVLLAVTLHEAAHGWVAERFGDSTARLMGRVTFNPIKHIDPLGTIIIPGILLMTYSPVLFGYAKPVPVDFNRLQPQRFGMCAVALAGPFTNLLLALFCALLLHLGTSTNPASMPWWQLNLLNAIPINCALAIFNMLPILPLDGGRVLRSMLPGEIGRKYAETERYGLLIVMLVLFLPPMLGFYYIMQVLGFINKLLMFGVFYITGH